MKSSIAMKVLLVLAALGGAVFALAGTAGAAPAPSHAKLEVQAPGQLTVGNSVNVEALLHSADSGLPIAGASVTFYMKASFDSVDGDVLLGQAVTDQNGVANLDYQPRSAGVHQLRVEYLTPGATTPEEAFWSHTVTGSTGQLYQSSAGVRIPGLNVWLLMALLATVWAILLSVALRVVAIARAGSEVAISSQARQRTAAPDIRVTASHFDMTG